MAARVPDCEVIVPPPGRPSTPGVNFVVTGIVSPWPPPVGIFGLRSAGLVGSWDRSVLLRALRHVSKLLALALAGVEEAGNAVEDLAPNAASGSPYRYAGP